MIKEFSYNWCDYFTPCPHKNCDIGSYECCQCENFINIKENDNYNISEVGDYKQYFVIKKGTVECRLNM